MQTITVRNVHEALPRGLDYLDQSGVLLDSRNGMMYEAPCPVTTVYKKPDERVVFWAHRNANPYFHFIEGLWMLKGGKDLETVEWYAKSMRNYSDDGNILWGAYGWRWRSFFQQDQLKVIIGMLRKNPDDRRAVLQMWSIKDLARQGKDVPCNTCIYFKIRDGLLNMTVSNRSNDVIWGAYGANAVHMSMLQEYMARRIGVGIGVYNQVSDSYHAYKDIFDDLLQKFAEDDILDYYVQSLPQSVSSMNPYRTGQVEPYPMISQYCTETWDYELGLFFRRKPLEKSSLKHKDKFRKADPFWAEVAIPIQDSWEYWKEGNISSAIDKLEDCKATDWKKACVEWLERKV
jgi:thymidylate synthase|tara:strand:- start:7773 stop:8810 length:1038 start_codon:yes stop_codon:yes gene_type:complete